MAVLLDMADWLKRRSCLLTRQRPSVGVPDDLIDCLLHTYGSQTHTYRQKLLN
jgi:hypothetical protein